MGPYNHPHYSTEEVICVEVFIHHLSKVMATWPKSWKRFVHGDRDHPHTWFQIKEPFYADSTLTIGPPRSMLFQLDEKCCCGLLRSEFDLINEQWKIRRFIYDGIMSRNVQ